MLRSGRRLAVDVGKVRVGLALSDFHGILASPLATVIRTDDLSNCINEIVALSSAEDSLLECYVGAPINLKGEQTASTSDAVEFASLLQEFLEVPVRLIDERLSTSLANTQLKQVGKSQKQARATIDQMAAVAILEYALSVEKASGNQPGLSIADWKEKYE